MLAPLTTLTSSEYLCLKVHRALFLLGTGSPHLTEGLYSLIQSEVLSIVLYLKWTLNLYFINWIIK